MSRAFIGIDVAIAKQKHLPIAVCIRDGDRVVPCRLRRINLLPPKGAGNIGVLDPVWRRQFALDTRRYVLAVCDVLGLVPSSVAIDAPRSPCPNSCDRRAAEVALDNAGISCFSTPSLESFELIREMVKSHLSSGGREDRIPHANRLWMLAGFEIFNVLADVAECLEVFPQATMRVLGAGQTHKSKPGGVDEQLRAAARYTGWPAMRSGDPFLEEIAWGKPHDLLDAYLCSWVASLAEHERVAFGNPPDDAIWTPRLSDKFGPTHIPKPAPTPDSCQNDQGTARSTSKFFSCPACGEHPFRRWPGGWDAHAVHKCRGLKETEPEARKSEFRRRFADCF